MDSDVEIVSFTPADSEVQEVPVTARYAQVQAVQEVPTGAVGAIPEPAIGPPDDAMPQPRNAPPVLLHPAHAARLSGVDLKSAQQVTRRLLLVQDAMPTYFYMPDLTNICSQRVYRFLYEDGFTGLHPAVDPASKGLGRGGKAYGVPPPRAGRKRLQIANLVAAVVVAISSRPPYGKKRPRGAPGRIFDLCGGCGHVGLTLAALLPEWHVVVVDVKPVALDVATRRANEAGLQNISTFQSNVEDLGEVNFDVAVALHACGGASDTVLACAVRAQAAAVVASCCVGGIVSTKGSVTGKASGAAVTDPSAKDGAVIDWTVSRSAVFRSVLRDGDFSRIARAADFGEKLSDKDEWRRVAKSMLEQDRVLWMREMNYNVRMVKMKPLDCTPKNDILIAWPGKGKSIPLISWDLDPESNSLLEDVRDASILKGFGAREVAEIEQILVAKVCDESSAGQYTFAKGLGKRKRKVVHAVAESMGLWHESSGKGAERCISIRRTPHWPLFFDSFVGVGGPAVEQVCDLFTEKVPIQYRNRRVLLRGNPRHITVIRPKEVSRLPYRYKGDKSLLLQEAFSALTSSKILVHGVGSVTAYLPRSEQVMTSQENATRSQVDAKPQNEAHFVVMDWPAATAFRSRFGLPPTDFHITLGFRLKDIHDVVKNISTLTYPHEVEFSAL